MPRLRSVALMMVDIGSRLRESCGMFRLRVIAARARRRVIRFVLHVPIGAPSEPALSENLRRRLSESGRAYRATSATRGPRRWAAESEFAPTAYAARSSARA